MASIWVDDETKGLSNYWDDISFNRLSDSTGDHPGVLNLVNKGAKTKLYSWGDFDFSSQETLRNSRIEEIWTMSSIESNALKFDLYATGSSLNIGQYDQIASGSSTGKHLYENVLLNGYDSIEGGRYADTLYGYGGNDNINGGSGNDLIVGGDGDDRMDGQSGEDTIMLAGNSSDYSIESSEYIDHLYGYGGNGYSGNLKGSFYYLHGPGGSTDQFKNIEWLQFDDKRLAPSQLKENRIYGLTNTYARDLIVDRWGQPSTGNQNSFDAKFYNLGQGRFGIMKKGESTIDEITGLSVVFFQDQNLTISRDIAGTFNQVKGIDDVSGVVFRLYNAAFARLPDIDGLANWIDGNRSGGMTFATSAQEFASSEEFKIRYGANPTDTQYITTLYSNVLERSPDAAGLTHYKGLLSSGKTRGELLLDFSESPENRVLFTQVTGLS